MLNVRQEIPTLEKLTEMLVEQTLEKYNERVYLINNCSTHGHEYDLKELNGLIFVRKTFCFCDQEFDFENNLAQISKAY